MQHPAVLENLNSCYRCGKTFCSDCVVNLKGNLFCGACKVEAVKDLQSGVTGTELPLASIGRRFAAITVDWLIQIVVFFILALPLGILIGVLASKGANKSETQIFAALAQIVFQIVAFVGGLVYEALFLKSKGATPGKLALGLKVVGADGEPLTTGQAWIRPLVKMFAGVCAITYIVAFFRPDKCTIHDLAARTRVIKVN